MSEDISHLLGRREMFWELQEITKENPNILKHGAFFDWMCTNYVAAVAMNVRAFIDHRNDVQSLWRVLFEILKNPGVISRRAHCALYRGTSAGRDLDMGNRTFNNVVGKGRNALRQGQIKKDLHLLEDSCERVQKFVNKRIAHRTPESELRRLPIFNELDDAMNTIDQLFCKYNLLLTASGMSSAFSTRQYNWKEALYEPWIKPGSKFRPEDT